jgi:hypothetical protein
MNWGLLIPMSLSHWDFEKLITVTERDHAIYLADHGATQEYLRSGGLA